MTHDAKTKRFTAWPQKCPLLLCLDLQFFLKGQFLASICPPHSPLLTSALVSWFHSFSNQGHAVPGTAHPFFQKHSCWIFYPVRTHHNPTHFYGESHTPDPWSLPRIWLPIGICLSIWMNETMEPKVQLFFTECIPLYMIIYNFSLKWQQNFLLVWFRKDGYFAKEIKL